MRKSGAATINVTIADRWGDVNRGRRVTVSRAMAPTEHACVRQQMHRPASRAAKGLSSSDCARPGDAGLLHIRV
jgi:hypothetical protein